MSDERDIGAIYAEEVETARQAGVLSSVKLAARCAPALLQEVNQRYVDRLRKSNTLGEFRLTLEIAIQDNGKLVDVYNRMAAVVDVVVSDPRLRDDTHHWLAQSSRGPQEDVVEPALPERVLVPA